MTETLAYLQLVTLIAGVGGLFVHIGHRDQQLVSLARSVDELKSIVADLVKTQIAATTNAANSQRLIDDLSRRIEHLEHHRCVHCGSSTRAEVA